MVKPELRPFKQGIELLDRRVKDGIPTIPEQMLHREMIGLRISADIGEREHRQHRADDEERDVGDAALPSADEGADEKDRDGDVEVERRDGLAEEEPDARHQRGQQHRAESENLERADLANEGPRPRAESAQSLKEANRAGRTVRRRLFSRGSYPPPYTQ